MSSILNNLSVAQLKRAVAVKEHIEQLETELSNIFEESSETAPVGVSIVASKKRTMSAAAKAKISAAQKAMWAKERGESSPKISAKVAAKTKKALKIVGRTKITPGTTSRGKRKSKKATLEW